VLYNAVVSSDILVISAFAVADALVVVDIFSSVDGVPAVAIACN
jgi:hypothetical protein